MELDGLFLDLYGTLTDGDRAAVEGVCADVVRNHGLSVTAGELSVAWGDRFFAAIETANDDAFLTLFDLENKTLVEVMESFGVAVEPTPYVEKLEQYWRNPPLQPEVAEFLRRCDRPICIVSNADRSDAETALASHGIRVAELVTSEDARGYKPAPGIFEMALERTGWRRDRVLHVGDSLHSDIGGAIAAGISSGWVNRSHRIYDVGTGRPDHEFADLLQLADLVRNHHPSGRAER